YLVIAEKFFLDHFLSVIRSEKRPRTQPDLIDDSGEPGSIGNAVGNGAGHGIDDNVPGVRVFFGGCGVADAQHIARALDERVLEASAGGEEWPVVYAGELNTFEHAFETLVGAARRGKQAVKGIECGSGGRFEERRCWNPGRFHY